MARKTKSQEEVPFKLLKSAAKEINSFMDPEEGDTIKTVGVKREKIESQGSGNFIYCPPVPINIFPGTRIAIAKTDASTATAVSAVFDITLVDKDKVVSIQ